MGKNYQINLSDNRERKSFLIKNKITALINECNVDENNKAVNYRTFANENNILIHEKNADVIKQTFTENFPGFKYFFYFFATTVIN